MNHRLLASLIPSALLHIVRGGGHLVLPDSAHEVGPVITDFLRGGDERLAAGTACSSPRAVPGEATRMLPCIHVAHYQLGDR